MATVDRAYSSNIPSGTILKVRKVNEGKEFIGKYDKKLHYYRYSVIEDDFNQGHRNMILHPDVVIELDDTNTEALKILYE